MKVDPEIELLQLVLSEQRAWIGRELHDSALQALAGVSLRLSAVGRLMDTEPAQARQLLSDTEHILSDELRELRNLVLELRDDAESSADGAPFGAQVHHLVQRLRRVWNIRTHVEVSLSRELAPHMARELKRIVQEALSNAARHGGITQAAVKVTEEAGTVYVDITQFGRGFPFEGTLDDDELAKSRRGPVSLKARVRLLGGRIRITSSPIHAVVHVEIPFEE